MRAAVLSEIPGPLAIADVQIDKPGPHEVLVRTVGSGLCHSDLHYMQGRYTCALPAVLGHEAAGVVEAVGSAVTSVKPGDHVVACLSVFCGHCRYCLSGRLALCEEPERLRLETEPPRLTLDGVPAFQFARVGGFAEQMLLHEHGIVKIRPDMPLDRAALIGCAVTTGIGSVVYTAQMPPGSTAAVIGCGGVGLNCVQGAAIAGASRIIAIDTLAWKLELARSFGATDLIDASEVDTVEAVRDLTDAQGESTGEAWSSKSRKGDWVEQPSSATPYCFAISANLGTAKMPYFSSRMTGPAARSAA